MNAAKQKWDEYISRIKEAMNMPIMNDNFNKALRFLTMGSKYFNLVEWVAKETINATKASLLPSYNSELKDAYKWHDFTIITPLLFNFYHGLELTLKGLLTIKEFKFKHTHDLSYLFLNFTKEFPENTFAIKIEKYIDTDSLPALLSEFCKSNKVDIDTYCQSFKYPVSSNGKQIYDQFPLKYKGEEGIPFFEELVSDSIIIRKESESLYKSLCPDA
jgi:hypothetical protein